MPSLIFGTTDSPPLTSNNTVWAERADGKFQLLPYSIDISLSLGNRAWYDPGLYGYTSVAQLCNQDEACWADTIATCEQQINKFIALDPVARLDQLHAELDTAGMLRGGDEGRYNDLRLVLTDMVSQLPAALENYRQPQQPQDYCSNYGYGVVDCGGSCQYIEDCYLCDDAYYENPDNYPQPGASGGPIPAPTMGIASAAVADVAPTGPVTDPTFADAGVPVEVDAGEVPTKPDFCYYYDRVAEQKDQVVYAVP